MCMFGGGGSSTVSTPKVDPAPTTVQASDVDTATEKKKEKRNGFRSTVKERRDTILGELGSGTSDTTRSFLGGK